MRKHYSINITDYKVLLTIKYLNELNYLPSSLGVYKILSGVKDEETEMFQLCETFQVIVSFTNKKVTRIINNLVSNGYLKRTYDQIDDDSYYLLTDLGKTSLDNFKKHHKIHLKKHEINKKRSFIKINH